MAILDTEDSSKCENILAMILIKSVENKLIILTSTLCFIVLIGIADYATGIEMSFSLFYILPIVFLALYKGTKKYSIIIASVFAAVSWFICDSFSTNYSSLFFLFWNAFIRLIIFLTIGLTFLYLKIKDKKLKEFNRQLIDLNNEKNKIIGIAAHDIRNPIGAIYSLSDILRNSVKEEDCHSVEEELDMIETLSSNALYILKNLLNISAIESGKLELNIESHDYIGFIEHQIRYNQILASNKKIKICLETSVDKVMADFDRHYLGELVDNLISNAIKYSFQNSSIIVKVSENEKGILTEIIDHGKGISATEQYRLFNYFQKTTTQPTNGEQSTGLGLAISKKIITLHNGEIGVKSEIDQGSNFYFTLPFKQPDGTSN